MAEAAVESPQPETSSGLSSTRGVTNNDRSPSPPPNCAICLGNCINKCYSDSCMHQFCYKCLLEWSKVKAVCPLCKQPFKSIIHNVKSNDDYDQHFIPQANSTDGRFEDFVWPDPISTSRHFQFRTTLTVDPRGELAIQQLLSTHSMTNSLPHYNTTLNVIRNPHYYFRSRRSRDISSSQYRRSLYDRNLWTHPLFDITGRYRETSPEFFREYPGSKNRLVPFLQRELNALIPDDSIRAMNMVHRILSAIDDHPIRGRFLRQLVQPEIGSNTEHFLYEFYTYARSPYDLFGYDRHSQLLPEVPTIEEESSDSDVLIVSVERAPSRLPITSPEIIEINSESSHDSDVVIREPTPPVLVDLAITTASTDDTIPIEEILSPQVHDRSQMPAKIRYKRSRKNTPKKRMKHGEINSCSTDSDSSSSTSDNRSRKRSKKLMLLKMPKSGSSQDNDDCSTIDEDATERREKRKKLRKRKHYRKREYSSSNSLVQVGRTSDIKDEHALDEPDNAASRTILNEPTESNELFTNVLSDILPRWFQNLSENRRPDEAGPSGISSNSQLWYTKPDSDSD